LHGDKSQGQRKRALDKFRRSEVTILVATDVAARGIDIADITHVINYSTPQTYDDYVHRIGRAGRAGKTGTALTFITA
jgi:superfamily II DNA/RNA helicase